MYYRNAAAGGSDELSNPRSYIPLALGLSYPIFKPNGTGLRC